MSANRVTNFVTSFRIGDKTRGVFGEPSGANFF